MVSKKTDDLLELMKKLADGPRQQSPMEAMEGLACVWDNVECTDYSRIRDSTGEILEERLCPYVLKMEPRYWSCFRMGHTAGGPIQLSPHRNKIQTLSKKYIMEVNKNG